MITNEIQYQVTKSQILKFKKALDKFDAKEAAKRTGSNILAKAERDALRSQFEELKKQTDDYEALKSGLVSIIEAKSLEDLPEVLIKARIARGLSQKRLAEKLGLKEQQLQRFESENYMSASLRRLAEIAKALNLKMSEIAQLESLSSHQPPSQSSEIAWKKFPIDEMYGRNWFKNFSGSRAAARDNAEDLIKGFVQEVLPRPLPVFHRLHSRGNSQIDRFSLFAWQCRVLHLAKNIPTKSFDKNLITSWFNDLESLSRFEDGPHRARQFLGDAGICVVIEPHLSHTYLDGAALLTKEGKPIIGLTLRYDRLDNFWFVLFHELIHVAKHLNEHRSFFDDLDAEPDAIEKETDELAGEALIADSIWETALPRYVRTTDSVLQMAEERGINPAIIAGRIRLEANDFTILNELVGYGRVRKYFPEVTFGH